MGNTLPTLSIMNFDNVFEEALIFIDEVETEENKTKDIYLLFLSYIRKTLKEMGNINEIDESFPILELKENPKRRTNCNVGEVLGYCETEHKNFFTYSPTLQIAKENKTNKIEIKLTNENNELLSMEVLIPIFLHELAHSITPGIIERKQIMPINNSEKKFTSFLNPHNQFFYQNFALILKKSEELNIYHIRKKLKKFSVGNLRRFDAIDIVDSSNTCGSSPYSILSIFSLENLNLFAYVYHFDLNLMKIDFQSNRYNQIDNNNNNNINNNLIQRKTEGLRVTITNKEGLLKVIICSTKSKSELILKAKQKFKKNYNRIFYLPAKIEILSNDQIGNLPSDSTLLFTF